MNIDEWPFGVGAVVRISEMCQTGVITRLEAQPICNIFRPWEVPEGESYNVGIEIWENGSREIITLNITDDKPIICAGIVNMTPPPNPCHFGLGDVVHTGRGLAVVESIKSHAGRWIVITTTSNDPKKAMKTAFWLPVEKFELRHYLPTEADGVPFQANIDGLKITTDDPRFDLGVKKSLRKFMEGK